MPKVKPLTDTQIKALKPKEEKPIKLQTGTDCIYMSHHQEFSRGELGTLSTEHPKTIR